MLNKSQFIGRLTKDPELRYTQSVEPVAVTQFDLAVDRMMKDKDGNATTDFFRIVVWRKQAENVHKYCFKGSLVYVEGELQNRSYDDKDGIKRYVTELVANRVVFLTPKKDQPERENNQDDTDTPEYSETSPEVAESDPFADFGEQVEIDESELPF